MFKVNLLSCLKFEILLETTESDGALSSAILGIRKQNNSSIVMERVTLSFVDLLSTFSNELQRQTSSLTLHFRSDK